MPEDMEIKDDIESIKTVVVLAGVKPNGDLGTVNIDDNGFIILSDNDIQRIAKGVFECLRSSGGGSW